MKRNFVTPIKKPLVNEKALRVTKKAALIAGVITIAFLCSG